ncbi:hypothetical protein [Thalassospira povalilytica]|uniref:hypothetical protein n=1 Tax=Thalassospira povalilytica TaxID=732237 RepID=UPI003AA8B969
MFSFLRSLRLRLFIAKVQAELMAQCGDQPLVNKICQYPEIVADLDVIRQTAYYRKDSNAAFLSSCYVLGAALDVYYFSPADKKKCAALLAQRLAKARSDPHFSMRHFQIFGDLEDKLSEHLGDQTTD